jgi:hypothetical protein
MRNKVMFLVLVSVVILMLAQPAYGNVYATRLRVTQPNSEAAFDGNFSDGTGARIRFVLNEMADTALVRIKSGATIVRTLRLLNAVGDTSVLWTGDKDAGGPAGVGSYTYEVYCSSKGHTKWEKIWTAGTNDGVNLHFGGIHLPYRAVAINRNITSKQFGLVYIAHSWGGDTDPTNEHWIDVLRPDSVFLYKFGAAYPWAVTVPEKGVNGSGYWVVEPWHMTVATDDKLYVVAQGRGEILVFNTGDTSFAYVNNFLTIDVRGVAIYIKGADTLWNFGNGGPLQQQNGLGGLNSTIYESLGYLRYVAADEEGYLYAAYGSTGGSNVRTLIKMSITGDTLWSKPNIPGPDVGAIASIGISYGKNLTSAADDRMYIYIRNSAAEEETPFGIYSVNMKTGDTSQVVKASFVTTNNYSLDVAADNAGNVYWVNGAVNEAITCFSPPDGYNFFVTPNPSAAGISVSVASGVEHQAGVPVQYAMRQNYPNPFNPTTTISFDIPHNCDVSLKVFDVLGREISVLVDQQMAAGSYSVLFDLSSVQVLKGRQMLASGVYLYRLQATALDGSAVFVQTRKMAVVK